MGGLRRARSVCVSLSAFSYYIIVRCSVYVRSSGKVKKVHLLFAEQFRHKPTLHDFGIAVFHSKCTALRQILAEPMSGEIRVS